jgi:hypothetical protein
MKEDFDHSRHREVKKKIGMEVRVETHPCSYRYERGPRRQNFTRGKTEELKIK